MKMLPLTAFAFAASINLVSASAAGAVASTTVKWGLKECCYVRFPQGRDDTVLQGGLVILTAEFDANPAAFHGGISSLIPPISFMIEESPGRWVLQELFVTDLRLLGVSDRPDGRKGVLFSMQWYLPVDLPVGEYSVAVESNHGVELSVTPSKSTLRVVEPSNDLEIYSRDMARGGAVWSTSGFQSAERSLLMLDHRTKGEFVEPMIQAIYLYSWLDSMRAYEYSLEYIRRFLSGKRYSPAREDSRASRESSGTIESLVNRYHRYAIAAGISPDEESARTHYGEFIEKALAGEPTGQMPEEMRRPLLSDWRESEAAEVGDANAARPDAQPDRHQGFPVGTAAASFAIGLVLGIGVMVMR